MKIFNFFLRILSILFCVACSDSDADSLNTDREFIKFGHKNQVVNFVPFDYTVINDEEKLVLFDHDLALGNLSFNTKFKILNDEPILISTGADFVCIKISNNYLEIYKASSDFTNIVLNEKIEFSSPLEKNVVYQMGFKKTLENTTFYLRGNSISVNKVYNNDENFNQCIIRGKPYFKISKGSFNVSESLLSSDYQNKPKISIYGDSFIEGFSLIVNNLSLKNRWCAKLSSDIGADNCLIDGKGGDMLSQSFLDRFTLENSWFKSKYVILSIGTNNKNPQQYIHYMQKVIEILKANGQIPILVTLTPRAPFQFSETGDIINKWIVSSGEIYVDMNKAVTISNDSSIWKKDYVFSDGIHPTLLAYTKMYDQLKVDCPFIF